ncbi:MAG: DUF692 domain-containing protein [Vulcanimicrobiota bacterium]
MVANRWNIPDYGLGMGLRTVHYEHILTHKPQVDFFEIISENFLSTQGRPLHLLDEIASKYRILMHGVSMSVGSTDPLDFDYLGKLKALANRLKVPFVSDHLCWTGVLGRNTHDLLPVPLTEDSLRHVAGRVRVIQDFLELPVALENPSNYLEFSVSQMGEAEYMARLTEEADCGLLLDVNNVYVSAFNHGFDPDEYIQAVPVERILYHHVAGHTHKGTHIVDTHSDHVVEKVWEMYEAMHMRTGGRSTMVEWDDDIPAFEIVHQEVLKAQVYRDRAEARLTEKEAVGGH